MMYSKTCDNNHEAETLTVEAENDDEAMEKMMTAVKEHLASKHEGMEMTDEEMKADIMSSWTKSEGGEAAAPAEDTSETPQA